MSGFIVVVDGDCFEFTDCLRAFDLKGSLSC